MNSYETPTRRVASPEWVIGNRSDTGVDKTLAGGWGVSPAPLARGASYTNFAEREMSVPTGDTPVDRAVRTHELIHARISPTSIPSQLMEQFGVSPSTIRLAEEMRVNFVANCDVMRYKGHEGTRALADGSEKGMAQRCIANNDWQSALHLYLNTLNTDIHKTVKRALRKNPVWKDALTIIDKEVQEWNTTSSRGAKLRISGVIDTDPIQYRYVNGRFGTVETSLLGTGFIDYSLPMAVSIEDWLANPPQPSPKDGDPFTRAVRSSSRKNRSHNQWEKLQFGMTSLTEPTTSFLGKRKRPSMVGKHPSRPDRLLTDPERRIFREVVRSNGGIVVFDCSGSMSVSHKEVRDIVAKFAGATVVAYTYRGSGVANAWVLARNNRMISERDFEDIDLGNGNGVDAPILRWAIKQRKSKKDFIVWVTDGYVTGKNDNCTENLIRECALLSKKHNIISVSDCDEALHLIADMKRTGRVPKNEFVQLIGQYVNGGC